MAKNIQKVTASVLKLQKPIEKKRSGKEMRDEWQSAINDVDFDLIESLDTAMQGYVNDFILDRVETEEPRKLEKDESNKLGREYNSLNLILNALAARKSQMRAMVFNHLNIELENEHNERPVEYMPGKIETDEGVTFKREGGTQKDPSVDLNKVKETFDPEIADQLFEVREVTTTETIFNEDKFLELLDKGEITLEQVREVLIDNGYNSPRFTVR